jgi:hypothetical protein
LGGARPRTLGGEEKSPAKPDTSVKRRRLQAYLTIVNLSDLDVRRAHAFAEVFPSFGGRITPLSAASGTKPRLFRAYPKSVRTGEPRSPQGGNSMMIINIAAAGILSAILAAVMLAPVRYLRRPDERRVPREARTERPSRRTLLRSRTASGIPGERFQVGAVQPGRNG